MGIYVLKALFKKKDSGTVTLVVGETSLDGDEEDLPKGNLACLNDFFAFS